jgi:hypothetical protein
LRIGLGIALLQLLLLLLLLELALLHFFHDLLRRADGSVGTTEARPNGELRWGRLGRKEGLRLFRLLLLYVVVLILWRTIHGGLCTAGDALSRAEDDLARRSVANVSGDQDVVPRTLEQLG